MKLFFLLVFLAVAEANNDFDPNAGAPPVDLDIKSMEALAPMDGGTCEEKCRKNVCCRALAEDSSPNSKGQRCVKHCVNGNMCETISPQCGSRKFFDDAVDAVAYDGQTCEEKCRKNVCCRALAEDSSPNSKGQRCVKHCVNGNMCETISPQCSSRNFFNDAFDAVAYNGETCEEKCKKNVCCRALREDNSPTGNGARCVKHCVNGNMCETISPQCSSRMFYGNEVGAVAYDGGTCEEKCRKNVCCRALAEDSSPNSKGQRCVKHCVNGNMCETISPQCNSRLFYGNVDNDANSRFIDCDLHLLNKCRQCQGLKGVISERLCFHKCTKYDCAGPCARSKVCALSKITVDPEFGPYLF